MAANPRDITPRKWADPETGIPLGLHLIHWNSGGSSICAVGQARNGTRWLAPTNWVYPLVDPESLNWDSIVGYTSLIEHPGLIDTNNPSIRTALDNLQLALKLAS